MKNTWDKWGIGFSSFCLVHCILMGLWPIILPSFHFLFEDLYFHATMDILVLFFSIIALGPTYINHGFSRAHFFAILGLLSLTVGFAFEASGHSDFAHAITISGSILMTIAHLLNWKYSLKRSCC